MLTLLCGNNILKVEGKYRNIKKSFSNDEIFEFDLDSFLISDILASIYTVSLFVSKKLIIIRSLVKNKEKVTGIIEELKNNPYVGNNAILFYEKQKVDLRSELFKFISKEGKLIDYSSGQKDIYKIVEEEFIKNEIKADREVIEYLATSIGGNDISISEEVKKVVLFKFPQKEIKKEEIESLSKIIFSYNTIDIWKYIGGIEKKDIKYSLKSLNKLLLQDESTEMILAFLERQVRLLIYYKLGIPLGISNYGQANIKEATKKFDLTFLKTFYSKLADAEYAIKQGNNSIENVLFLLTFVLCQ